MAAILVYYFMPDPLVSVPDAWAFHRPYGLVAFYLIPFSIEIARLAGRIRIPMTRAYEQGALASHIWFVTGAVGIILLLPAEIAAPAILATAVGDVVLGETRHMPLALHLLAGWGTCAVSFLVIWRPWDGAAAGPWLLAGIGGVAAVAGERLAGVLSRRLGSGPRLQRGDRRGWSRLLPIDDDFVMQVIPALLLWLVLSLMAIAGAGGQVPAAFTPSQLFPTARPLG